jgi:hypothetical protein
MKKVDFQTSSTGKFNMLMAVVVGLKKIIPSDMENLLSENFISKKCCTIFRENVKPSQ